MGQFFAKAAPPKDPRYQGIGPNSAAANKNGAKPMARSQLKKPAKRIDRLAIGQPSNFQHTYHIGSGEMRSGDVDPAKIRSRMAEVQPVKSTTTAALPPGKYIDLRAGAGAGVSASATSAAPAAAKPDSKTPLPSIPAAEKKAEEPKSTDAASAPASAEDVKPAAVEAAPASSSQPAEQKPAEEKPVEEKPADAPAEASQSAPAPPAKDAAESS